MSYLTRNQTQALASYGKGLDIYKKGNTYVVELNMPGFLKEEISIDYKEGVLSIVATHSKNDEFTDREYFYRNRRTLNINRSFRFSDIDENAIEADYTNGVLRLVLPVLVPIEKQPRKIEIK